MDRLPFEILSDIFLMAILRHLDLKSAPASAEFINAPLRISQVCRFWRAVALNDGQLWSHLTLGGWTGYQIKIRKPIFDTWLARSKEAPLNYRINLNIPIQGHKEFDDIVNQLVSKQHRWRDVQFGWFNICLSEDNHEFHLTNMPLLTSMSLDTRSPLRITIDFGHSLQLTAINIRGDFDLLPLQRPFQLLTQPCKLTFTGECLKKSAIVSCLNFLKAAIFLEEFTIYFDKVPYQPTSPSNDNCQFAIGLRCLRLNYARGILDNVNIPSLEVFSCDSYPKVKDGSEVLVDFFRRSRPPLTYLSLKRDSGHEDIVIPILQMLPTLVHLELFDVYVSTRFYRELTVTNRVVCPMLEAFRFTFLRHLEDEAVCADALIVMLKSRAQIMDSFKTVRLGKSYRMNIIETACLSDYHHSELNALIYYGVAVGKTLQDPFTCTKVRRYVQIIWKLLI
ncbi:hypothetical protein ACEPAI_9788 [Sanghuangporus weigelae]